MSSISTSLRYYLFPLVMSVSLIVRGRVFFSFLIKKHLVLGWLSAYYFSDN